MISTSIYDNKAMPCSSIGPKRFWTGPICLGTSQIGLNKFKNDFLILY